jgi:hypothetical protein
MSFHLALHSHIKHKTLMSLSLNKIKSSEVISNGVFSLLLCLSLQRRQYHIVERLDWSERSKDRNLACVRDILDVRQIAEKGRVCVVLGPDTSQPYARLLS